MKLLVPALYLHGFKSIKEISVID